VVVAAGGYPGDYATGDPIAGIEAAEAGGALVFQAGTRLEEGVFRTNGGRVLAVSALGQDFDGAFAKAYAGVDAIDFAGCYSRRDIGYQVRRSAQAS
jgi:phosphoribosylamine---glycine ligase